MSRQDVFGWSYPAGCSGPPEYYENDLCEVCGVDPDDCECPECDMCGSIGDSDCYEKHDLEPAHDSVDSYCDWVGVAPIRACLRATEKWSDDGLLLVMRDGRRFHSASNKDRLAAEELKPWERISKVIVTGSAWDDSDWVYEEEVVAGNGWSALEQARDNFVDALDEHRLLTEKEEEDEK